MQICVLHGGNRSVLSCWDVDSRPWDRVIWLHSCSNIYIKHHTIEKYLVETSNWRSDCAIRETADQRRKLYEKHSLPLIFTFYLNRGTSVLELFPVVVFQLKKTIFNEVRVDPFTGNLNRLRIAVERFKMSQITFISIHILANQNSYHDDKST